jgi:hypothetical protein
MGWVGRKENAKGAWKQRSRHGTENAHEGCGIELHPHGECSIAKSVVKNGAAGSRGFARLETVR